MSTPEEEMVFGYLDGRADDRVHLPPSLANRSESYRHGWMNGRDDRTGEPRASAGELRAWAKMAMNRDAA